MVKIYRTPAPLKTVERKAKYLPKLMAAINAGEELAKQKHLKKYNYKVTKDELKKMQHKKCAYCEAPSIDGTQAGDIEHFQTKDAYPEKAFDWENLFLSCSRCNQSLKKTFDVGVNYPFAILKPDVDNPMDYFEFKFLEFVDSSGNSYFEPILEPKITLGQEDRLRALKTIEVLGLNSKTSIEARSNAMVPYIELYRRFIFDQETINQLNEKFMQNPKMGYSAWIGSLPIPTL